MGNESKSLECQSTTVSILRDAWLERYSTGIGHRLHQRVDQLLKANELGNRISALALTLSVEFY